MSILNFQSIPITGISFVSSLGSTIDDLVKNLSSKKRGLSFNHRFQNLINAPLGESHFSSLGIFATNNILLNQIYCSIQKIAKETKVFEKYHPSEIGFFLGTSTAETYPLLIKIDQMFKEKSLSLSPYLANEDSHGFLVDAMKEFFPFEGFSATFTTACSSAAVAIAEGFYAINTGLVKACFVGGFDILNPLTVCGFNSLQIIDSGFCTPFAKQRKGINLSEGGGLFLLENKNAVTSENNYCYIRGVGGASDAYHMTKPDPNGYGSESSMKKALHCAQMSIKNIDYINAHGTGTIANDASETLAVARLFKNETPISSTKAFHGHALGGSAAIEVAVSIAAFQSQNIWDCLFDNEEYEDDILHVTKNTLKKPINTILSNSFGFGGTNMSLIISRAIN